VSSAEVSESMIAETGVEAPHHALGQRFGEEMAGIVVEFSV
jgi:hypothetical protein